MSKRRQPKFEIERKLPALVPMNTNQANYMNAIGTSEMVIVLGPAGTGKTFIAATKAADMLRERRISKIILTRPNVASGRSLGFFPGTLEEKIGPWVIPFTEVISDRMGQGAYEIALKRGDIEIVPFEVMRGRTFRDAFVILDEAQNTTPEEMKMFLTRLGDGSTVIVNGDIAQSDLKTSSGLKTAIDKVKRHDLPVPIVEFGIEDIVRSNLCRMWVEAFYHDPS